MGRLLWFDRAGTPRGEIGDAGAFRNPRLSPNGSQVVVERTDTSGNRDLWIVDVARGVPTRFTFDPGRDASPVWSADGREIAWQGNTRLYRKSASGAGREESLRDEPWIPDDWLPDGSGLLAHPNNPRQIWLLPLTAHRSPHPVVESRSITTHARVSPDGVWVAFATNESGRFEVHLQHLRGATGRWQVSSEGGIQPKWRRDGRELFYLALDGTLMAVPLKLGDLPEIGKPQPLFQTDIEATTGFVWHQYDVTPDGQRFLVNAPQAAKGSFTVVVNWPALLKP
jgi:Tol biopolymer transport system component